MRVKTTLKAKSISAAVATILGIAVKFVALAAIEAQSNSATVVKYPTPILAPTILAASGNSIYAVWSGNQTANWEIAFKGIYRWW